MGSSEYIVSRHRNGIVTGISRPTRLLSMLTPYQILVGGYIFVTLAGALLLCLPVSTVNGRGQSFLDALFLSVSGISTSGLSVVDVGTYYTLFGQGVLLAIFQIGGIGYMTIIIFFVHVLGLRTSIVTEMVAKESLAGAGFRLLGRFFLATMLFTLVFELTGGALLTLLYMDTMPFARAAYFGMFHSVSAFCTAGFGLHSDSLVRFAASPLMNATINIISLAGGIGFFVLFELYLMARRIARGMKPGKLSVHSRFVCSISGVIMLAGSAVIFASGPWEASISVWQRIQASLFQAISASTTDGFNSIDIGRMGPAGLVTLMALMFIGASPGSTGGGIKTTTIGAIAVFLYNQVSGREDAVNLMRREIPTRSILKAFGVFTWFIIIIAVDAVVMSETENGPFINILFEIVSAMGNTGLSMGLTPSLSATGKILLIITMFIGRVGPLTVGFFMAGEPKPLPYRYAEEDIFIG